MLVERLRGRVRVVQVLGEERQASDTADQQVAVLADVGVAPVFACDADPVLVRGAPDGTVVDRVVGVVDDHLGDDFRHAPPVEEPHAEVLGQRRHLEPELPRPVVVLRHRLLSQGLHHDAEEARARAAMTQGDLPEAARRELREQHHRAPDPERRQEQPRQRLGVEQRPVHERHVVFCVFRVRRADTASPQRVRMGEQHGLGSRRRTRRELDAERRTRIRGAIRHPGRIVAEGGAHTRRLVDGDGPAEVHAALREPREKVLVGDRADDAGEVERVPQLVGGIAGVGVDRDRADARGREPAEQERRRILEQQQHRVAGNDISGDQARRDALHFVSELAVRPTGGLRVTRLPHQEGLVGKSFGPLGERGGDVPPAERVHGRQQDAGRDSHGVAPASMLDPVSSPTCRGRRLDRRLRAAGAAYVPVAARCAYCLCPDPRSSGVRPGDNLRRLTDDQIRSAADALVGLREGRLVLAGLPAEVTPEGTEDVQRIINAVSERVDRPIRGWKTYTVYKPMNPPFYAPIYDLFPSGAEIPSEISPLRLIEPEIMFRVDRDLPARERNYDVTEIMECVTGVVGFEVIGSRFRRAGLAGQRRALRRSGIAVRLPLGSHRERLHRRRRCHSALARRRVRGRTPAIDRG